MFKNTLCRIVCLLFMLQNTAYAATIPLHLLPVQGNKLDVSQKERLLFAVQEGLKQNYQVQRVAEPADTSVKKDCTWMEHNETQGTVNARLRVSPNLYGAQFSIELKNECGERVELKTVTCEGCDETRLLQKIEEVAKTIRPYMAPDKVPAGSKADVASGSYGSGAGGAAASSGFNMPWWGWVLGAVAVGVAVGSGGGGGDSGSAAAPAPQQPANTGTLDLNVTFQ